MGGEGSIQYVDLLNNDRVFVFWTQGYENHGPVQPFFPGNTLGPEQNHESLLFGTLLVVVVQQFFIIQNFNAGLWYIYLGSGELTQIKLY